MPGDPRAMTDDDPVDLDDNNGMVFWTNPDGTRWALHWHIVSDGEMRVKMEPLDDQDDTQ
jgi:hypothetical protein